MHRYHVLGVFYRSSTKAKAEELGLSGWVKNLSDGRVEAVFEGPRNKLEEIIAWCKKGSKSAKVKNVKIDWRNPQDLINFEILR